MNDTGVDERLAELESQLAFQEELLQSLNTVAARQDAEILELKRRLDAVAKRVQALADSADADDRDEAPPHY